jgi:hypothetical protein
MILNVNTFALSRAIAGTGEIKRAPTRERANRMGT